VVVSIRESRSRRTFHYYQFGSCVGAALFRPSGAFKFSNLLAHLRPFDKLGGRLWVASNLRFAAGIPLFTIGWEASRDFGLVKTVVSHLLTISIRAPSRSHA
jgi:hypothetical protein